MKPFDKNETKHTNMNRSHGGKPEPTPSPAPPRTRPDIEPDRTFQPQPKSPHIPDMPDDPNRKHPSKPKDPPPEITPSKVPPKVGPPPAERKPHLDIVPIIGGVVCFRPRFLEGVDLGNEGEERDFFLQSEENRRDPEDIWERKRLMIVLFTPKRGQEK